jgi:putative protein-disulfide isomerase
MMYKLSIILLSMLGNFGGHAQTNKTMTDASSNPLLCDPITGICELPNTQKGSGYTTNQKKPVKIIYFTDPICSSCWGIEPQLRKLKLEYGNSIEIDYRMGGLLPDWSYNSGGISKPSDVAHHWDEVSKYYDMPIDGEVWLEDPLNSSYPPSIAFKAAQMQSGKKAVEFMRRIREMVFLEKKNITKWEHISAAATETGLDAAQLKTDFDGKAKQLFEDDLALGKTLGVRGFPTMFFIDSANHQQKVYGVKPYPAFEEAVVKTFPAAEKASYAKDWKSLFSKYPTLTTKEFAELSGLARADAEALLQKLADEEVLIKTATKNGDLWAKKNGNL